MTGMPARDDRAGARDGHRAAALELDRVAARLLDEPHRRRDRLLVGDLVGPEREVADEERGAQPAPGGAAEHEHLVDVDRHRRGVAEHGHGAAVADEHEVDAGRLGGPRAREVVGGDHHDRLAEALLLGQPRQRHRQPRRVVGDLDVLVGSLDMASRSPVPRGVEDGVVDEPGRADAGGDGDERRRRRRAATGSRSSGAHERQVLGLDAEAGHRGARRAGDRPRRRARRRRCACSAASSARLQRERALAVVAAQVHVAARQRQPVGLAHRRADLDPHGQVEVARPGGG